MFSKVSVGSTSVQKTEPGNVLSLPAEVLLPPLRQNLIA